MVIGTDTEVGKTAVAAGFCTCFGKGVAGRLFQTRASGMTRWEGRDVAIDGAFVQKVSGFRTESLVTPLPSKTPWPFPGARMEGRRIDPDRIRACLQSFRNATTSSSPRPRGLPYPSGTTASCR
jgi:dethiobiotin synthetase